MKMLIAIILLLFLSACGKASQNNSLTPQQQYMADNHCWNLGVDPSTQLIMYQCGGASPGLGNGGQILYSNGAIVGMWCPNTSPTPPINNCEER